LVQAEVELVGGLALGGVVGEVAVGGGGGAVGEEVEELGGGGVEAGTGDLIAREGGAEGAGEGGDGGDAGTGLGDADAW